MAEAESRGISVPELLKVGVRSLSLPLSKPRANPQVARCYMVFLIAEGIYCGRSWQSKYHFVSERREARFRCEEIAAREEKVDTSPA
jgi:hypothetical protein